MSFSLETQVSCKRIFSSINRAQQIWHVRAALLGWTRRQPFYGHFEKPPNLLAFYDAHGEMTTPKRDYLFTNIYSKVNIHFHVYNCLFSDSICGTCVALHLTCNLYDEEAHTLPRVTCALPTPSLSTPIKAIKQTRCSIGFRLNLWRTSLWIYFDLYHKLEEGLYWCARLPLIILDPDIYYYRCSWLGKTLLFLFHSSYSRHRLMMNYPHW